MAKIMLSKSDLEKMIEEYLAGTDNFLVELEVSTGNDIHVLVDNDGSTSVADCIGLSRHIEGSLDRDSEDFSLQVSSPGLNRAFTHTRQYVKNVGRDVKVWPLEGAKIEGKLVKADENGIEVVTRHKERIEGRKAKHWVETSHELAYDDIKETKVVIAFK